MSIPPLFVTNWGGSLYIPDDVVFEFDWARSEIARYQTVLRAAEELEQYVGVVVDRLLGEILYAPLQFKEQLAREVLGWRKQELWCLRDVSTFLAGLCFHSVVVLTFHCIGSRGSRVHLYV